MENIFSFFFIKKKTMPPTVRTSQSSHKTRYRDPSTTKPPYQKLIHDLIPRYPVLQFLDDFFNVEPTYRIGAAVLEFKENHVDRVDFYDDNGNSGCNKLCSYLRTQQRGQHRLYILEDLHPEFIELLGGHLNVDGTVFAHQILTDHWASM